MCICYGPHRHESSAGGIPLRFVIAVALVFGAAGFALTSPSPADAACDTGRAFQDDFWHDGWYRTASTIPGGTLGYATSQILEYSPYIAPTSGSESTSAWPMIENDEVPQYYSQVGWLKYATGTRRTFSEWIYNDSTGTRQVAHREYPAQPVGNWTLYEVYWDPNTQRIQHWINANLVQSHRRFFTMRRADIYGETHELRSQMPGGYNFHEQFTESYVANLADDIYEFLGTVDIEDPSIHDAAVGSSTRLDIWDKACAT
jgi:hypothetical protein